MDLVITEHLVGNRPAPATGPSLAHPKLGLKIKMVDESVTGQEEGREDVTLTPWEQHSSVISIPRFDYNAPAALSERSHTGFLVTCTIKREKSATKEAIAIIEKHLGISGDDVKENLGLSSVDFSAKKRKISYSSEEIDGEDSITKESKEPSDSLGASDEAAKGTGSISARTGGNLSLVKLTRSGLLLFTFQRNHSTDTVEILSKIFHTLDSGDLRPPIWCHRILPIQATCNLKESDLHNVVSKLVKNHLGIEQDTSERTIKFAVGFNRRGIEESEMNRKTVENVYGESTLLDRNKCLRVAAGAIKDVAPNSYVDLKSPELSVLVEVLPLSAVRTRSLVVAVSVLPHHLVNTKPRLCVKPLVSVAKMTKKQELKSSRNLDVVAV